jgi:hypothetical protein
MSHASLNIRVDDYAMHTDRIAYGAPHDVTVVFLDEANEQLAHAHSIEPHRYILAVHPNAEIGNCQQGLERHPASSPGSQIGYAACYQKHSSWVSSWAPRVRTVDITVGACTLRHTPVSVHASNNEWLLWWVPHPHIGGIPRRHFELVVKIDSRTCIAVVE